jgi:hypothetical protein
MKFYRPAAFCNKQIMFKGKKVCSCKKYLFGKKFYKIKCRKTGKWIKRGGKGRRGGRGGLKIKVRGGRGGRGGLKIKVRGGRGGKKSPYCAVCEAKKLKQYKKVTTRCVVCEQKAAARVQIRVSAPARRCGRKLCMVAVENKPVESETVDLKKNADGSQTETRTKTVTHNGRTTKTHSSRTTGIKTYKSVSHKAVVHKTYRVVHNNHVQWRNARWCKSHGYVRHYSHGRVYYTHSHTTQHVQTYWKTVFSKELSSVEDYSKTIKVNMTKFNAVDQFLINKCLTFF